MKDTTFYNEESRQYSAKRYPARPNTFTQYFFRARLAAALRMSDKRIKQGTRFLEVGCADGVVARAFIDKFDSHISEAVAVDLSPEMIQSARELTSAEYPISYQVRDAVSLSGTHDFILELGVLNYLDVDAEIPAVADALSQDGTYLCSIAGTSSSQYRLKGGDYRNVRSYSDYERLFASHFRIIRRTPVGYFVPYLWKLPAVARLIQPAVEYIGAWIAPHLALELIYELEKID